MNSRALATIAVALAALIGPSGGCAPGYGRHRLLREDIHTVYVEFFDNSTFRRDLEPALTRAVVDELKLRTPLLFAPRASADSVLGGELLSVDESTRVKSEDDTVLIRRVSVSVRFFWRDRLTETFIVPPRVVAESVRIAPSLEQPLVSGTFDPLVQRAETPFEEVFRQAAQSIVDELEQNW